MQSALLYRFQAAMLGAIVGETISTQVSGRVPVRNYSLDQLIQFYAESLIHPDRIEQPDHPMFREALTTAEGAIALLPVFLYFHEDFPKLRQNVEAVTKLWQNATISELDLLAIGYAISEALLESLSPRRLITKMLTAMLTPPEGIPKLQRLQQVETMVQQGVGLEDAVQLILTLSDATTGDAAIALALYCFLSTPTEFRLSILRAVRTNYQVAGVAALTGALSGAYNSTIALPADWRFRIVQAPTIERLSIQLLARWSGVHDMTIDHNLAIAAPQVIRKIL